MVHGKVPPELGRPTLHLAKQADVNYLLDAGGATYDVSAIPRSGRRYYLGVAEGAAVLLSGLDLGGWVRYREWILACELLTNPGR